ncbi:MAG: RIP metalloprotease RseP [Planctomycetes bacterium]|jgi:regulator of sigma E protease|nr:RIP metalloprotease RseP [Planctomycetota bacterium]
MFTVIVFLIVLSVLVFAHELGHFWTARKLGVKAEEFGFGFPPRIFGFYKDKNGKWKKVWGRKEVLDAQDTIYSVNAIPLGGFVKIKGENGDGKEDKDSFAHKKIWQRALILAAGVLMNIVLAIVLFSWAFMVNSPRPLDGVSSKLNISDHQVKIFQVLPNTPAQKANLQSADVLKKINGQEIVTLKDLYKSLEGQAGKEISIQIKRGVEEKEIKITPTFNPSTNSTVIGTSVVEVGVVSYPWYLAIWEGIKTTGIVLWSILYGFVLLFKALFTGAGASLSLAGPIGIADLTGQAARLGLVYLLNFTALLSLNLAVLNILPLPALDGGRILFLLIEKIKGKPVKKETEAIIHNIGFLLLMLLVLFVTFKDVGNLLHK